MKTAVRPWPLPARQQLENELRLNVEFSRALYEGLREQYSRNREEADAVSRTSSQDGSLLFDRCRQTHDALQRALDQYRAELHRFTRLVVDRIPPENYEELLKR